MKTVHYALTGAALLALAACGPREEDTLENVESNMEANELNALADNAAAQAELEALNDQQEQLETTAPEPPPAPSPDATDPTKVEDDVQGM